MKRMFIVIASVLACFVMTANPLVDPDVKILQLFFDDTGWTIQLGFKAFHQPAHFDSVVLSSSTGTAKLKLAGLNDSTSQILTVRNTDLTSNLGINKDGDLLRVKGYDKGMLLCEDNLIFGNDPSAVIGAPKSGQSIKRISEAGREGTDWFYALSDKPSTGVWNDTTGCCATLKGIVYAMDNSPVPGRTFYLDFPFITGADGSFETQILTKRWSYTFLKYDIKQGAQSYINIQTLTLAAMPLDHITQDIHLANTMSIEAPRNTSAGFSMISYYPNPLIEGNTISYRTVLPIRSMRLKIEIFDEGGKKIKYVDIEQSEGAISLPKNLRNGTYFLNLVSGTKIYSSTKILVLR